MEFKKPLTPVSKFRVKQRPTFPLNKYSPQVNQTTPINNENESSSVGAASPQPISPLSPKKTAMPPRFVNVPWKSITPLVPEYEIEADTSFDVATNDEPSKCDFIPYTCCSCQTEIKYRPSDPVRCLECGSRLLIKKRIDVSHYELS